MGSAPLLQADSNIGTINTSELKSPHCIPVSTSGAITDGVIRLPAGKLPAAKPPRGHWGAPQSCMLVHGDVKPHTAIPPPHNFRKPCMNWSHTCPHYLWNHFSPHIWRPISHYLSFTARFSSPSHFKYTIPVTIHCKFKGPMVTHQNHHPPLITASELSSRTMQVYLQIIPPSGATSSLTDGVTRPCIASRGAHTSWGQ